MASRERNKKALGLEAWTEGSHKSEGVEVATWELRRQMGRKREMPLSGFT